MTTIIAIETPTEITFGWDLQITHGIQRVPGDDKVFTNNGIIFGMAGNVVDANVLRYANLPDPAHSGWDIDRWVTRDLIPATNNHALVAVHNRLYRLSEDLSWYRDTDGSYSIGSGSYFALGALTAGASIKEALAIANRHDTYTGPDIRVATATELREGINA